MTPSKQDVTFEQMLRGESFFYGAELVTTRGIAPTGERHKLVELGEALADDPRIGWISVTDNPGGSPMLPADWLGRILASKRCQVVIHLTCKDLNRNGLESAAWRYAAEGFRNILALTGDLPTTGYCGQATGVFDLDSVGEVALLNAMNQGLEIPGRKGTPEKLPKTDFFIGCAVSPFKRHEREQMPQYFKLARKLRCGAHWVIPQLGYDMRKYHEVTLFMKWAKVSAPVIGNVYVLNKVVAGLFNKNQIPGCVVSDKLLETVNKYAAGPDKGQSFFRELAARQLAVFKGLGFAAGYLAGTAKAENFGAIIDLAESYGPNDWKDFAREIQYPQPDEFYLFDQDPQTGLGNGDKLNPQYVASLAHPPKTDNVTMSYRFSRKVHGVAFTPGEGQWNTFKKLYEGLDKKKDGIASRALHVIERASKEIGFGCKDCGDCSLPDCAYLCPRASCSKASRNGPCGGSFDGVCEQGDKECLWARAYDRLKYYGESEHMLDGQAAFYDAKLAGTSSWANAWLGRDHHHYDAKPPEAPKAPKPAESAKPADAPKPSEPAK
ncbi:MAG: methylenetetrahydrofolate reductase C-terminal domain-containing protein [Phycisphaeraceae bacterium]|nr:methylenetetrahydrofolate reductase C-terminal domain-containing protein [Phycisphaeraceae bacterium]